MNQLHIYPTARALRTVSLLHKEQDGFLPALMRMDEFEQRAVLIENKIQVDPLQRILLLREAAKFEAFDILNVNRDLVRFFTKSDAIFKFFEEMAAENVNFETLASADAYVEFETHLAILEQLLENYHQLLEEKDFTDKAFIPKSYKLNEGFLESYEKVEIHLEGYLSHFELELLEKVSQKTQVIIHYSSSKFNKKMLERFEAYGITLPIDRHLSFDLSNKKVIAQESNTDTLIAKVFSVEEREEQIAVAFEQIEAMVSSGIEAENIVLILPDESFKDHFTLFDSHNNLNFAMGYDYSKGRVYRSLEAIYAYWQTFDKESRYLLERYGFELERIDKISSMNISNVQTFFNLLNELKLLDAPLEIKEDKEKYNERVEEKYLHFLKIFETEELSLKEWLFLWLKALSKITLDDVRGGLITVMGVLETRGVSFEGVVIVDFNEGIVPTSSSKDQFLNSSVRTFANLPTKNDREALQKQYYKRLLEQASQAAIIYSSSDNKLPSKFIYELGLEKAEQKQAQFDLLYAQPSQITREQEPLVEDFYAYSITWSASRLKTYLDCKRKYYYRYIQKIQAKEDDELNEGLFLHSLLDHLYKEKNAYETQEEMQNKIDRLLDELLPFDDAKVAYKKLLWKEKLKGFVHAQLEHFSAGWKVVEREKEFSGEIGGLRFKGRIDRIDQNDTATLVLDYKSGSITEANRSKNLEKLSDFQMSIYHALLSSKYKNISLAFMKILEKGEVEEITVLEEKNALLAEHLIALKQTKSFVAKKTDNLQKCKYCEFALMCERGEYL
jgi:inactivated superfamily I helicase/RecB family exonuclease